MDKPTLPTSASNAQAGGSPGAGSPPGRPRLTRTEHWQRTRRLTAVLLSLWLLTGFCAAYFARELAGLSVFGWPLSFYLAAQGASLVYLAILACYAWRMRKLDKERA